jgi:STE24 endopeptidase
LIPVAPYLIAPLFNKFQRLSSFTDKPNYVQTQVKAEKLAKMLGFPLGKIWVIDGSRRSAHSNAFFYGLPGFAKHIVIYGLSGNCCL